MPRTSSPLRRSLATLSAALLAAIGPLGSRFPQTPQSKAPWTSCRLPILPRDWADRSRTGPSTSSFGSSTVPGANDGEPGNDDRLGRGIRPGRSGWHDDRGHPANGSGATISGATYSQFANGVVLRVRAASGVQFGPDKVTVEVALTAVGDNASPRAPRLSRIGTVPPQPRRCRTAVSFSCRTVPMATSPCQSARATASAHAGRRQYRGTGRHRHCESQGRSRGTRCTATPSLPLWSSPATRISVGRLQTACRAIPLIYTLDNTGALTRRRRRARPRAWSAPGQEACVDYVSSRRSQGDLYMYLLFKVDIRASFP